MTKFPENLYILYESNLNIKDNKFPVEKILVKPKGVSFKEKFKFDKFDDKKNDNTSMDRITCYHSIERAIEMTIDDNSSISKNYDIYSPYYLENEEDDKSFNFFYYEYLVKSNLIQPKSYLNRESWIMKPTYFKYIGTIEIKNNKDYKFIMKNYQLKQFKHSQEPLQELEEGFIENDLVRYELKKKDIQVLFNCTEEKNTIIYPDIINYGNRLSKKRYSSYWYDNPMNAIISYVAKHLVKVGILEEEDFVILYHTKKLYINEELKNSVLTELSNLKFFLNIINVPNYTLFSGKHLGYGWDIFEYTYTYDKKIYVDNVREISSMEMMEDIIFCNEQRLIKAEKTQHISRYERIASHGYLFKI